jgi:putative addiction module component (TIGR02574 family)
MAKTLEEVMKDALSLPTEERGQLSEDLRDSVRTAEEREIEAAWVVEAERRLQEIEDGTAQLIPAEVVMRELKAKYSSRRRRSR